MTVKRAGTAAILAAAILLAGCGTGDPTPVAPVPVDSVTFLAGPPTALLVLDPLPDGMRVANSSPAPIEPPGAESVPLLASATLYGDPRSSDPLDGRLVLVGTSSGSASIGGPRLDVPGVHPVDLDLGYGSATFVPDGDRAWVVVPALAEDSIAYVVGQGLSEQELIAAAKAADLLGAPPTIDTDGLPVGLATLAAGVPGDGPGSWEGEVIEVEAEHLWATVSVVQADPRLAMLWGFWIVDADGDSGSRRSGVLLPGTKVGGANAYGVVWADGANVISVVVADWRPDASEPETLKPVVEQIAAALAPGSVDDVIALSAGSLEEPTAPDMNCPADATVISGRSGDVLWAYAAGLDPSRADGLNHCAALLNLTDGMGSAGQDSDLPAIGVLIPGVVVSNRPEGRPQHTGELRTGIAPPGTVRVVVTAPDLSTKDALLSGSGPRPGEQLFAAYFSGDWSESVVARPFSAAAFDAAGRLIDEVELP